MKGMNMHWSEQHPHSSDDKAKLADRWSPPCVAIKAYPITPETESSKQEETRRWGKSWTYVDLPADYYTAYGLPVVEGLNKDRHPIAMEE